jgi:hypothetical protein
MKNSRFSEHFEQLIFQQDMPFERLRLLRMLLVAICLVMLVIGPYDTEYHATVSPLMFRPSFPFPWFPSLGEGFYALKWLACMVGMFALVGYRSKVTLPLFALMYAILNYYIHCFQGHYCLNHIHLVVGLIAVSFPCSESSERASFILTFMAGYIALLFFQAGVAKLIYGGFGWFSSGDTLYMETILDGTEFGRWFTQFGWFFPLMGMSVAVFELMLPFAFLFRSLHPLYGATLLLFHLGTFLAMGISFWFLWPLYIPLFRPHRIWSTSLTT